MAAEGRQTPSLRTDVRSGVSGSLRPPSLRSGGFQMHDSTFQPAFVAVMAFTDNHFEEALNTLGSLCVARNRAIEESGEGDASAATSVPSLAVRIYARLGEREVTRLSTLPWGDVGWRVIGLPAGYVAAGEADWGTPNFSRIVRAKFHALQEEVAAAGSGAAVIWMDTDLYFFSEPCGPLAKEISVQSRAANPPVGLFQVADTPNICTGFFVLPPWKRDLQREMLAAAARMLEAHVAKIAAATRLGALRRVGAKVPYMGDEKAINAVLRGNPSRFPASPLPRFRYVNGRDFFGAHGKPRNIPATEIPRAILVHNNWIKGVTNKVGRFKQHGMWIVQ